MTPEEAAVPEVSMWAGGYTADAGGSGVGITALAVDPITGDLAVVGTAVETPSPSFLLAHGDMVYAVGEAADRVEAFRRGPGGSLQWAGGQPSGGSGPCHLHVVDGLLLTSHYGDGTVAVHPLADDGSIGAAVQLIASEGSGPRPQQDGPHAHATLHVGDGIVLSADLGTDAVFVHALRDGRLDRIGALALPPGTGPRHMALLSSGRVLLVGELDGTLHALEGQGASWRVAASTSCAAVPDARDSAAEVRVSADERRAYVGLRGSERIAVVGIAADGALAPVAAFDCGGATPRHHVLVADRLHVANQGSGTVASFRLDAATGLPATGPAVIAVPSPTYLLPLG
ncbi:6-phosphogluconolactonase [Clavibacter michiganensis]|uniref:6-phosphogluconolactonase n=1 Tax=Clavibacter michiganensis TaxID=28447 RepID=A0A251Z5Y5_9MICO|nr:beta-propeller fold lactonase family protein [Clavibacter michiganensis]OUE18686.1 6-phosphogluconolactonase [Clavibacter michiganensis]OUE31885.1 6-phosphogluconolactonase [Clavibacter michiganensis]